MAGEPDVKQGHAEREADQDFHDTPPYRQSVSVN
jgi:hypothetical protein